MRSVTQPRRSLWYVYPGSFARGAFFGAASGGGWVPVGAPGTLPVGPPAPSIPGKRYSPWSLAPLNSPWLSWLQRDERQRSDDDLGVDLGSAVDGREIASWGDLREERTQVRLSCLPLSRTDEGRDEDWCACPWARTPEHPPVDGHGRRALTRDTGALRCPTSCLGLPGRSDGESD